MSGRTDNWPHFIKDYFIPGVQELPSGFTACETGADNDYGIEIFNFYLYTRTPDCCKPCIGLACGRIFQK